MEIKEFDILLCKNNRLLSRFIKEATHSVYSHATFVLDSNHLLEIGFRKPVRLNHINYSLGSFDCYRTILELTPQQKNQILEFYQRTLNSKYDYIEAFSVVLKRLIPYDNAQKYICSGIINEAFKKTGLTLVEKIGAVTPADLSKSPFLYKVNGRHSIK